MTARVFENIDVQSSCTASLEMRPILELAAEIELLMVGQDLNHCVNALGLCLAAMAHQQQAKIDDFVDTVAMVARQNAKTLAPHIEELQQRGREVADQLMLGMAAAQVLAIIKQAGAVGITAASVREQLRNMPSIETVQKLAGGLVATGNAQRDGDRYFFVRDLGRT